MTFAVRELKVFLWIPLGLLSLFLFALLQTLFLPLLLYRWVLGTIICRFKPRLVIFRASS
jgi:hypothetical protein